MPAYNLKCKAKWIPIKSAYTIVYWQQNPDDDGYTYWKSVNKQATTEVVVNFTSDMELDRTSTDPVQVDKNKDGYSGLVTLNNVYELDYYHLNREKTDSSIKVDGNGESTLNIYYDRNVYDLRFYYAKEVESNKYLSLNTGAGVYTGVFNTAISPSQTDWNNFIKGASTVVDGSTKYYYFDIKNVKYGQKISNLWPASGPASGVYSIGGYNYVSWATENGTNYRNYHSNANIKGAYDTLSADLIKTPDPAANNGLAQSLMMYVNANAAAYTYELYFQGLDGEYKSSPDLIFNVRSTANGSGQDVYRYAGYTYDRKEYGVNAGDNIVGGTIKYYYSRNKYEVNYFENGVKKDTVNELFTGEDLEDALIDPTYPTNLPKGAYEFAGWYQSPSFLESTKVEKGGGKVMPPTDIALYAKWNKVTHVVKVYKSYKDYLGNTSAFQKYEPIHGTSVSEVEDYQEVSPSTPEGYSFIGWFYMNEKGQRVPFDFKNTAINKDIRVFPEFRSNNVSEYTVRYNAVDDTGKIIAKDIAPAQTYKGYGGMAKTLVAKTGDKLNDGYKESWYPTLVSHSIVVGEDPVLVDGKQEYVFNYVYRSPSPYTVKYLDATTGTELIASKYVADNKLSVTTEKFKQITGYVPDKFYKQLIVSSQEDQNIITFYYKPDIKHAPYIVKYYTENETTNGDDTDISNYSEYSSEEGIADIGTTYTAGDLAIVGYERIPGQKDSGQVTEDGLEINILYKRKEYPYKIQYLEYGSDKVLKTEEILLGKYKTSVSATGPDELEKDRIFYTISNDKKATIKIDQTNNVIKFYYTKKQMHIKYERVFVGASSDKCLLTMLQELPTEESDIIGSAPIINDDHYIFVGWFSDPECTQPIQTTDNKLHPSLVSATYYAKFQERALVSYSTNISGLTLDGTTYSKSYVNINTSLNLPNSQTFDNYQFQNWQLDNEAKAEGEAVTITTDTNIKAIYFPKYETCYYKENLDGTYSKIAADTVTSYGQLGSQVNASDKTYNNYTLNNDKSTLTGTVINPIENDNKYLVMDVYYDLAKYAVTFSSNNAEVTLPVDTYKALTVKHGQEVIIPEAYEVYGYKFMGWTVNGNELAVGSKLHINETTNIVANYKKLTPHDLILKNEVTGNMADTNKEFTYKVNIAATTTIPASSKLEAYIYDSSTGTNKKTELIVGQDNEIKLASGDTFTIKKMFEDMTYTIKQSDYSGEGYLLTKVDGRVTNPQDANLANTYGTMPNTNMNITYYNNKEVLIATGINVNIKVPLIIAGLSVISLILFIVGRKKV